jgi:hypothetical protein
MSLLQTFLSSIEAAMLFVAATVSRFEVETLQTSPSLRFFTVGAEPDRLFRQAVMFSDAPLHAFVTIPLLDAFEGRRRSWRQSVLRYGRFYVLLLVIRCSRLLSL